MQLVIQAGAVGRGGEVLVLDMGKPVRISEVAERLVGEASEAVEIVYTGLRPGEKLHEELFGRGELGDRAVHALISHVQVPPLNHSECAQLEVTASPSELKSLLKAVSVAGHPSGREMAKVAKLSRYDP